MADLAETQGKVLSAEIGSGQSRYRKESGGYGYRTSYFPNIAYQYTVNGQQYTHNAYAQRPSLINRQGIIQRIVDNYPVGADVTVYYDPQNPQEGYGGGTRMILLGVALLVVIIIAVVVAIVLATA